VPIASVAAGTRENWLLPGRCVEDKHLKEPRQLTRPCGAGVA
jgi:hypothetical protein